MAALRSRLIHRGAESWDRRVKHVQVHLHVSLQSFCFTRWNYFYFLFFSFFWKWLQLQLIALSACLEIINWNRSRSKKLKCVHMDISYYENDETGDHLNVLWFHFQGVNCEKKLWMSNIFHMLQLTGLNEVSTTFTTQEPSETQLWFYSVYLQDKNANETVKEIIWPQWSTMAVASFQKRGSH